MLYPAFAAATSDTALKVDAGANKPCIGLDNAGTLFFSLKSALASFTDKPFSHEFGS